MLAVVEIKKMKATIGQFMNTSKSSSIFDFLNWLDCQYELEEQNMKEAASLRRRR